MRAQQANTSRMRAKGSLKVLWSLCAGDITVHNERVIHGSGPNRSSSWRHAYVVAFRKAACIAEERSLGFTHSHNDETNWDVFHQHDAQK